MENKTDVGLILLGVGAVGVAGLAIYEFVIKKPTPPPPIGFNLTIEAGTGGTTDPPPGKHLYDHNTQVIVWAYPNPGYKFDHWEGDVPAGQSPSINPITLSMLSDLSISAVFVANPNPQQYTVTFAATAGGTVSPSGTHQYDENSYVIVTAIPQSGYKFVGWSGGWTGTDNPMQVRVWQNNMVVTANFSPVQQNGVQLNDAGNWDSGITYNGNAGAPAQVFASIVPYLSDLTKPIWIYRAGVWYSWYPGASWPDINPPTQVLKGDICSIYVTQPCFWQWI